MRGSNSRLPSALRPTGGDYYVVCLAYVVRQLSSIKSDLPKVVNSCFPIGMVLVEIATLQQQHLQVSGSRMIIDGWMTVMINKLLKITHGQWLYHNVMVHDSTPGTLITKRKEEIQLEIERQQELGSEGLLEEDNFLAEVRK